MSRASQVKTRSVTSHGNGPSMKKARKQPQLVPCRESGNLERAGVLGRDGPSVVWLCCRGIRVRKPVHVLTKSISKPAGM